MKPVKSALAEAKTLDFPGAITFRVLLSGAQTGGTHAVFEDIVQPGVGPGRHVHRDQDETFLFEEGQFDEDLAEFAKAMPRPLATMASMPATVTDSWTTRGCSPCRAQARASRS